MNIAQPFLARSRSLPELQAISHAGKTLRYGELAQRVCGLAGGLRNQLGLRERDRVVIYLENRPEFFELLLSCWVAGLCAVPVNAKLHPREVAHIVADCGASAIFTSASMHAGFPEHWDVLSGAHTLIDVDDDAYARCVRSSPIACTDTAPVDLAWLFYTSGTTGVPKGAMLSHRNLMTASLAYAADVDHILPGQTMLHVAALSHGSGLYALPHLFGGGHQVIAPGFSTDVVFDALQRHADVSMFAAPTMLSRLVRAAEGLPNPTGHLKTIHYGGGPMYLSDLLRTLDLFGPRLFQVYGQGESPMTITGLTRTDHAGPRDAAHLARLASCGTPRTGVEVRVVDEAGAEVKMDELGEVVTRSDCVMAGYWNNAKATASALRDGWLWTGDIGTLDERGYLTLRDRSKDLIIRGGSNIYPREIEEVLLKHPAVIEVSVVGRADADLGEVPVAFVVVQPGMQAPPHELDALCLDHIARFKRPRDYFAIDALPKNNYGKVLKTELRKRLTEGGSGDRVAAVPAPAGAAGAQHGPTFKVQKNG